MKIRFKIDTNFMEWLLSDVHYNKTRIDDVVIDDFILTKKDFGLISMASFNFYDFREMDFKK